jgi:ribosomal protein S18 acetylase RimI-like enzyme
MNFEYSVNKSTLIQVKSHLFECSDSFIPKLSTYVDVEGYSEKIFLNATRIEAFHQDELIGLIAVYINKEQSLSFISNVSVIPNLCGKGLAVRLFSNATDIIKSLNIDIIKLKVDKNNRKAIALYEKLGFQVKEITENKLDMILNLRK